MKIIKEFQGEYRWLSNFWPARVVFDGIRFTSVETAYVAAKTEDREERKRISKMSPGDAKRYGKTIEPVGWEGRKFEVMLELLRLKFSSQNPVLRNKLIATKNTLLEEGNRWNDIVWGVSLHNGVGANHLGRLLMQVRSEIQKGKA